MIVRHMSDEEWAFLAPLLAPDDRRGYRPAGHRRTLDAIFAVSSAGAHWRELPCELGKWNSVYRQFQRWSRTGLWDRLAAAVAPHGRRPPGAGCLPRKPVGHVRDELAAKIAAAARAGSAYGPSPQRKADEAMASARIPVTDTISLDPAEIEETFVRASGPGGQNVNKVSSAVMLRFDVADSPSLDEWTKARLARLAGNKMTKDGVLVLKVQDHRDQTVNRAEAQERLVAMIAEASIRPKPRRATKPTYASKVRRLESKGRRAVVKAGRRPVQGD